MASAHDGGRSGPGASGFDGDDWDTVVLDEAFVNAAELVEAPADERIFLRRRSELDRRVIEEMENEEAELAMRRRARHRAVVLRVVAAIAAAATLATAVASSFVAW